ncbi:unnamed protein product [Miscanthus lutarioriparius]|uniref:BRCT domain-containing protein n=1 Tax=Miscanthus lutarioriparius TaxID=422564 RepID=A0A811QAZ5_9POAL|nr:unnamed protein product [Miscanthus lutarioriparius]
MTPSYSSGPSGPAGGRRAATFAGASVFLSRNLVAPEVFDAVHDALRLNGAEVLLCADPSRTGSLDFHVISSSSHERFADLRAKGCNLLGPQCILSCAKERRFLPKQSYTCCLAMDGVKTLCSGFEKSEKVRIEELVTAMGGHLLTRHNMDVNFVIVKDVTAAKYKWALNTLKKPIVTMKWLEQCWIEHRVVPHEPYRILPFTGLNICVTKLDPDERKELEKMVVQNGDKYVVAQKWGNIHIVNPRWVEQSVARRACQDENSYLVCQSSSAFSGSKSSLKEQQNPEISSASASFQPVPATSVDDSVSMSQYLPASFGDAARISNTAIVGTPSVQEKNEMQLQLIVLICLDSEKKEVRRLAAWGVINIVKVTWLEDCNRAKKEVKVSPMHIATELLLKGFSQVGMENSADTRETKVAKSSGWIFHVPTVDDLHDKHHEKDVSSERKPKRGKHENSISKTRSAARTAKSSQQNGMVNVSEYQPQYQVTSTMNSGSSRSNIFKGRTFSFSNSFSHDKRPEVVDWVRDGGGVMVDDNDIQSTVVDFIIECHGQNSLPCDLSHSAVVSTQWIRSCLEENCLQDVGSHPIFSPLRCRIPFPGFKSFYFCISQYGEKERQLLKNLCFLLGAKFTEKAYKRVTHLICKFASGPKYEVYTKRGTPTITPEWLYECVKQDKLLPVDHFQPKPLTSQDQDAYVCTVSQYSTQATRFDSSELLNGCQVTTNNATHNSAGAGISAVHEETTMPAVSRKRRISVPGKVNDTCGNIGRSEKHLDNSSVPDVADAIEVLSSKIQDVQSPRSIFEPDNSVVQEQKDTHSFGISRSWLNMQQKQDNTPDTKVKNLNSTPVPSPAPTTYYPFSETQTESQVVGYEEDLTGRQKIIDRVRSQSINVTPSGEIP